MESEAQRSPSQCSRALELFLYFFKIGFYTFGGGWSIVAQIQQEYVQKKGWITDEELLMSGKDRFVMMAGDRGLLYAPIDENGWPIEKRVARHVAVATKIIEVNNSVNPDQTILIEGIPTYEEIMENGLAPYYHNPETAPAERVYYD